MQLFLILEDGKRTAVLAGNPVSRTINVNPLLRQVEFHRIVGRMLGHIFLHSNLNIGGVSDSLISLIKNEEEVYLSIHDLSDPQLATAIDKVRY